MTKVLIKCITVSCMCIMLSASVTSAQVCAGGYPRAERENVLVVEPTALQVIDRMLDLAIISSNGSISSTMRLAFFEEFKALRSAFNGLYQSLGTSISSRSTSFVDQVVDSDYLFFSDSTLLGEQTDEAVANSRLAIDKLNQARDRMIECLHNSFDRIQIVGTPNDNRCASGFPQDDWSLPTRRYFGLRDTLRDMEASVSNAVGVLSVAQRRVAQADFQYLKEEVMKAGVPYPRTSGRTNNFIVKVFNPIFLGLLDATVDGPTAEEAFRNATAALQAVRQAQNTAEGCLFVHERRRWLKDRFVD